MSTTGTIQTPQRTYLLERVTAYAASSPESRRATGFLGVHITDGDRLHTSLSPQIARLTQRRMSELLATCIPDLEFKWLDDAYGLGFVAGMAEEAFRSAGARCWPTGQLQLTVGDECFHVGTAVVCTWFPATLQASVRFQLDTAEHLLRHSRDPEQFQFVAIRSPEDAIEALGRCVNLLSDLGLDQKGSRTNRRRHRRQPYHCPCLIRWIRAGGEAADTVGAETCDVSLGGFSVQVPREFRANQIVELEFVRPDGPLYAAVRIAHCCYVAAKRYVIGGQVLESGRTSIISSDTGQATNRYAWLVEHVRGLAAGD